MLIFISEVVISMRSRICKNCSKEFIVLSLLEDYTYKYLNKEGKIDYCCCYTCYLKAREKYGIASRTSKLRDEGVIE